MTISEDLIAVASLKVGSAGTAYPCTRFMRTVTVIGPEQSSAVTYRHEKWTATCHHVAANLAGVASAWETVRSDFGKRGQRVTHATWTTGLRVLPETGTPTGAEERSIAGYPTVDIAEVADETYATWMTFIVEAESMIPVLDQNGVAEHDYTIVETENDQGLISTTQRGTVRLVNGSSAREWVDTEVIDIARAAAGTAGHAFSIRYTQGLDEAAIGYEFTASDRTGGGGIGVSEERIEDRTARTGQGRVVRTVSGYAQGPNGPTISAYVATLEPASSATVIRIRRDVSQPSVPENRVSFAFELLTGVQDARFPGIVIYSYTEAIEEAGGDREAMVQTFFDAAPSLRMGVRQPFVYTQTSTIEFIGGWADHGITSAFDIGLYARGPRQSRSGGQFGLRRVSMSFAFVSPTLITPLPAPLEINAFL